MLAHVKTHTSSYWAQSFVHVLEDSIATFEQSSYTPILDIRLVSKAYQSSKKRLFCFDYDVLFLREKKSNTLLCPLFFV